MILYINWFWFYCATRTLANTLETALTIIALSYFPFKNSAKEKPTKDCKFLWIVGFICAIRPTAAITWIPMCIYHISSNKAHLDHLIKQYLKIGLITLAYSTAIDSYCYGTFIFTPWYFLKVNVLNGVATFYGAHGFSWYFTIGLPSILGVYYIYFPFVTIDVIYNEQHVTHKTILIHGTIYLTLIVYSLIKHKEFRFILPLLPMIIHICSTVRPPRFLNVQGTKKYILIGILLVTNILPASYFSLIHQRGPLDAMDILRNELKTYDENTLQNHHRRNALDVLFLTPCHALPLYSHLHRNVTTRFLTCEPNLHLNTDYVDEADEFFKDPMHWINMNYELDTKDFQPLKLPAYVVIFDNTVHKVSKLLKYYRLKAKTLYSYIQPEGNYGKFIHVYKYMAKHTKVNKYSM
uniref:Mannosyltransferase n=1 Tax=Bracon brevicornis TaxID=1563983 RepID=A0A6V7HPF9_9HYME